MSEPESELEVVLETVTVWPNWVPLEEQCMWCNEHSLDPEEVDLHDNKVSIHYYCNNEECKHVLERGTPSYYGLEFYGKAFVEKYEKFTEEVNNNYQEDLLFNGST